MDNDIEDTIDRMFGLLETLYDRSYDVTEAE